MSMPLQANDTYLSRVRRGASTFGLEEDVDPWSKPETQSTKACVMASHQSSAQIYPVHSPTQLLAAIGGEELQWRNTICIIENISPDYMEVLGTAWNLDPHFFHMHALNPGREFLWDPRYLQDEPREKWRWDCIHGNFEYHGLQLKTEKELNSQPNYFDRHCFRSSWEGVETISSNTKISYYRVRESFYLFLVDAPLHIQRQYDGLPRRLRPSLRLPYASNRGGLPLPSLYSLCDKDNLHYSLFESLKSVFLHGWQTYLLFNHSPDEDTDDAEKPHPAVIPPAPLSYLLSSSISRTNLRYLSHEIQRISFEDIRDPSPQTNDTLHDRREDLVAFMKPNLTETIKYFPPAIDAYIQPLRDRHWPEQDPTQRTMTRALTATLNEATGLEAFLMETFQLLMSSISVQDAKLSVQQGQLSNQQSLRATQLTILASIYVPLSFVTGIFGMNLKELNGSPLSLWVFFVAAVIAAIVTGAIFLVLQTRSKGDKGRDKNGGHAEESAREKTWTLRFRGKDDFGSESGGEKSRV